MFETLLNYRLVWDTIDILIVAIILYYILSIIEGTRAVQILFGLSIVFLLYFLSQSGGLFTINWILGHFLGSIIIIIVILFQSDIRKALASIGRKPLLIQLNKNLSEEYVVEEVVKSTSYLSSTK